MSTLQGKKLYEQLPEATSNRLSVLAVYAFLYSMTIMPSGILVYIYGRAKKAKINHIQDHIAITREDIKSPD